MKRKILIIAFCASCGAAAAQTQPAQLPSLKGEYVLDSIKNEQNLILPDFDAEQTDNSLYFSCPSKIAFDANTGSCSFAYNNAVTKNIYHAVYKPQNDIIFNAVATGESPNSSEFSYNYIITETDNSLILTFDYEDKNSGEKQQYKYFFSLTK
jgi:hypothetical protein